MKSFSNYIIEVFDSKDSYSFKEIDEHPPIDEDEEGRPRHEPLLSIDEPMNVSVRFLFKAEKEYYTVRISAKRKWKFGIWELSFFRCFDYGFPKRDGWDVTGHSSGIKETIKIFTTVFKALKKFLNNDFDSGRTYTANKIIFTSFFAETSRVKLYKRFLKKLNDEFSPKYKAEISSEGKSGDDENYRKVRFRIVKVSSDIQNVKA